MTLTRRDLMKLAVVGGTGILLPRGARAYGSHYGGGSGSSPPTTPFQVSLPIPPVLAPTSQDSTTDYYEITMKSAQKSILPGLLTTIWGYNGLYPGPTIVARKGRTVQVTQTNNLSEAVSVHLHGGHTPATPLPYGSDGHPLDLISPGGSKVYVYPNNQDAAPLWYHDHALGRTGPHVYMGLAAFYILHDDLEISLNLPSGSYDIGLAIQDRTFNADGSFFYPTVTGSVLRNGFQGDTVLVNGAVQPYFQVAARKYRFRILNGSNASDYQLALQVSGSHSGPSFTQIGSDGGLLRAPVSRSSIPLSPAERADVVIDFSKFAVGTQIIMSNSRSWGGNTDKIMRFDVVRTETDTSVVPSTLRTITPLGAASVTRDIELDFDRNLGIWVLNGQGFGDGSRVDFFPQLGATEIWRFNNHSGMIHPMHIHDIEFQILDKDGRAPGPGEDGFKDTVAVPSWGTASVITQFNDNLGKYVFHCHKLEHEDHDMMGQFQVV